VAVNVDRDGAVAVVTVDRPEALNALNAETNELLLGAARELSADDAVRVVVLTGSGDKAFVAGADIAAMKDLTAEQARRWSELGQAVMSAIEAGPHPWIAAVNGFALGGGCELALACDFRLAADNAKFGQPEIGLGITPGYGGTQRLARCVGQSWANYLVLTGRHIRADEALRIGLVTAVHPKEELMTQALKLAADLAGKSPLAMRSCRRALRASLDVDLETGQRIERDEFALCFASADQKEGMGAFLEKRAPEFTGE
jgi:enoyl-CoA hydratase